MSIHTLQTIFEFLIFVVRIYSYGMIVYIFMSWLPGARESVVGQFMAKIYEPYLEPFRRIIPPLGMIDLSPIVAFIVLNLFQRGLFEIYRLIVTYLF
ncbi:MULTISPECIES: YggT family protein [Staphylococcus]|uniref:YggT family protein n=1 Tax=Staphylococcus agnetis TaxID=985762 RepID=A0A242VKY5_9STAP|nr:MULTISPECIES: YggT family protein [Staphylococcus]ALN76206.1 YggT family protein [Staphylococcus agnetis]MBY7663934.1 YggT family protein [Staphylococcus agnetis]MCO4327005.1 YggT family protein [Staphylococcus agnetis]MCO4338280.1 YggT family protein [Staphylococcus agnetis]MCO4341368.1 YggT family protein [Staphylococcus agnetis]